MDNWYYVGNYGQLGPLQQPEMIDLIECGAITRETYVWREGASDWKRAGSVPEFADQFATPPPELGYPPTPPPPPGDAFARTPQRLAPPRQDIDRSDRSPRSRVLGGVLQFIVPGVGRMYLGHVGMGIAQFLLAWCFGAGWLWSIIDGIVILVSNDVRDGYGRRLSE